MYLVEHGWEKFITWYDYESWYPIGRPIGKSIYPGMQVAAAVIHWFLKAVGQPLPLNDVCVRVAPTVTVLLLTLPSSCVFVPAYFSVLTCFFLFGMANEIRGPKAGLAAAAIMCVLLPFVTVDCTNRVPNVLSVGLFSLLTLCVPLPVATTTNPSLVRTLAVNQIACLPNFRASLVAAMSGTFWLWLVSLRGGKWIVFCIPCALMYFFMISAWG
jgi:hypothetical protein